MHGRFKVNLAELFPFKKFAPRILIKDLSENVFHRTEFPLSRGLVDPNLLLNLCQRLFSSIETDGEGAPALRLRRRQIESYVQAGFGEVSFDRKISRQSHKLPSQNRWACDGQGEYPHDQYHRHG